MVDAAVPEKPVIRTPEAKPSKPQQEIKRPIGPKESEIAKKIEESTKGPNPNPDKALEEIAGEKPKDGATETAAQESVGQVANAEAEDKARYIALDFLRDNYRLRGAESAVEWAFSRARGDVGYIGAGLNAVVLDIGDGKVARLSRERGYILPAGSGLVNEPIESVRIEDVLAETYPKVDTSIRATRENVDLLQKDLKEVGYRITDLQTENLAFVNGRWIVIDPGAIRLQPKMRYYYGDESVIKKAREIVSSASSEFLEKLSEPEVTSGAIAEVALQLLDNDPDAARALAELVTGHPVIVSPFVEKKPDSEVEDDSKG